MAEMGIFFVMAFFAELAGLHLGIVAFLAGQFVRKKIMEWLIETTNSYN